MRLPPAGKSTHGTPDDLLEARMRQLSLDQAGAAGAQNKDDLHAADFELLSELGHGNGGTVRLVRHRPTQRLMAKKALYLEDAASLSTASGASTAKALMVDPESDLLKRQIVRELQILHSCACEYIVGFYGAFVYDGEISICMEYMDLGSLDKVYRLMKKIEEPVLAQITLSVLEGLVYLYLNYKIVHRDVKPNNILVNSRGKFKICDFGVSGEAINSVVKTFVGTSAYMSPERIKGETYSVQSDVWSLGITLMELASGRFPFPPEGGEETSLAVFELLDYIVNEDAPTLPANGNFTPAFVDFIARCLVKSASQRPTPLQLMLHPLVKGAKECPADMLAWTKRVQEANDKRKK